MAFAGFRRVINTKTHLAGLLCLTLAACATSDPHSLTRVAHELHSSLEPKQLREANHGLPDGARDNPHFTADAAVVRSIAHSASQGTLGGDGIDAALYALYHGESEVGMYGLQAASDEDAEQLDDALRSIWAHNVRLDRVRVHRGGRLLVVVWHDGVSPSCWREVNDTLVERLAVH